jgi:hypothetical protein
LGCSISGYVRRACFLRVVPGIRNRSTQSQLIGQSRTPTVPTYIPLNLRTVGHNRRQSELQRRRGSLGRPRGRVRNFEPGSPGSRDALLVDPTTVTVAIFCCRNAIGGALVPSAGPSWGHPSLRPRPLCKVSRACLRFAYRSTSPSYMPSKATRS